MGRYDMIISPDPETRSSVITWGEWERGYTFAYIWDCGDDECSCIQPRIERVTPNRKVGYPWVRRETLWDGTFVTLGYSGYPDGVTYESLVQELREAVKAYEGVVWRVAE